MISQLPPAETQSIRASHEPVAWRLRLVEPAIPYRAKEEFDPVMPLPKWASWALIAWAVATSGAYTAVLARWWE